MLRRAVQAASVNTSFLQVFSRQLLVGADAMQRAPHTAAFASAGEPKDGDAKVEAAETDETSIPDVEPDGIAQEGGVAELQVSSRALLESQPALFHVTCKSAVSGSVIPSSRVKYSVCWKPVPGKIAGLV